MRLKECVRELSRQADVFGGDKIGGETYRKTVKIPVHHATTKRKCSILNNLTARLTYAVRLTNARIIKSVRNGNRIPEKRSDIRKHTENIGEMTGLSAGFVQQCEDKVLWAWRQYRKAHREWEYQMSKAKDGSKWKTKLEKRKPSYPFTSQESEMSKVPTRFDKRTGELQEANIELTNWVIHISTLKKEKTIDILLNPAEWHKIQLERAEKIKSFEIIWHAERENFIVHITCEYQAPSTTRKGVVGTDLGVERPISAVLINEEGFQGFDTIRSEKREKIQKLNDRISHLRRLEKWEALKKLRNKRRRVAKHYDRMLAKEFARRTQGRVAMVGNPAYIRYRHFKGNGDRIGRKVLQNWSFSRQVRMIEHEKAKTGCETLVVREWGTSSECWKCSSKIERPVNGNYQRSLCPECGEYDADFVGGMNIAKRGISLLCDKSSDPYWEDLAGATDDIARNRR